MTDNSIKKTDMDRVCKDEGYRISLSPEQLSQLPATPDSDVEIGEAELDDVSGGALNSYLHLHKGGAGN